MPVLDKITITITTTDRETADEIMLYAEKIPDPVFGNVVVSMSEPAREKQVEP